MNLEILDLEDQNILQHFEVAINFIASNIVNGNVFVHCVYGQSRSATCIIAYLLSTFSITLNEAYAYLLCARPCIHINPGFLRQLQVGFCLEMFFFSHYLSLDFRRDEVPVFGANRCAFQGTILPWCCIYCMMLGFVVSFDFYYKIGSDEIEPRFPPCPPTAAMQLRQQGAL